MTYIHNDDCIQSIPDTAPSQSDALITLQKIHFVEQLERESPDRLVALKELSTLIGRSKRKVRRLVKYGDFPPPIKRSARQWYWTWYQVSTWMWLNCDEGTEPVSPNSPF